MNEIKIRETSWPLRLSLRGAINIEEAFGNIKRAMFGEDCDRIELTSRRAEVLHQMILGGQTWEHEEEGKEFRQVPSAEELEKWMLDGLTYKKAETVILTMVKTINDENEPDWTAEAPEDEEKN